MTETFELNRDDRLAVDIAKSVAHRLLRHPAVTPWQATTVRKALHALDQLPRTTPEVAIEYGIVYTAGTDDFRETRYIDFSISESAFRISEGGSVYDKAVGSDSMPGREWLIEVGGHRETDCDLYDIEDSVAEYLNLGAEITVTDAFDGDDDSETTD